MNRDEYMKKKFLQQPEEDFITKMYARKKDMPPVGDILDDLKSAEDTHQSILKGAMIANPEDFHCESLYLRAIAEIIRLRGIISDSADSSVD